MGSEILVLDTEDTRLRGQVLPPHPSTMATVAKETMTSVTVEMRFLIIVILPTPCQMSRGSATDGWNQGTGHGFSALAGYARHNSLEVSFDRNIIAFGAQSPRFYAKPSWPLCHLYGRDAWG